MYSQDFIELVKAAKDINFYIGTGNPQAKILIIGKEAAINKLDNKGKLQYTREFENNISDWERDKEKNPSQIANWDLTNYSPLYPYKGQQFKVDQNENGGTSRTWYNYQNFAIRSIPILQITPLTFMRNFSLRRRTHQPQKKLSKLTRVPFLAEKSL